MREDVLLAVLVEVHQPGVLLVGQRDRHFLGPPGKQVRPPRAFNRTLLIGDVTGDRRSDLLIESTYGDRRRNDESENKTEQLYEVIDRTVQRGAASALGGSELKLWFRNFWPKFSMAGGREVPGGGTPCC